MYTNTITYKGFTVSQQSVNNRFYVDNLFNVNGYPTLNHAKGAITNHIKAMSGRTVMSENTPAVAVVRLSRNKREGKYAGKFGNHKRVPQRYRNNPVFFLPSTLAAMDSVYGL